MPRRIVAFVLWFEPLNAFRCHFATDSYYRLWSTTRVSDSWQRFESATLLFDSCQQLLSTTLIKHACQEHKTT